MVVDFYGCKQVSSIIVSARNRFAIKWFTDEGFGKVLDIYGVPIDNCKIERIDAQIYNGKPIEPK